MSQAYRPDTRGRDAGRRSRGVAGLCLFAALLVVHWGTPALDWVTFKELSSILNRMGSIGGDENVSPPSIQPPGLSRTTATETRHHGSERQGPTDDDGVWGLVSGPAALASVLSAGRLRSRDGSELPPPLPRAFDQRAPPSTT